MRMTHGVLTSVLVVLAAAAASAMLGYAPSAAAQLAAVNAVAGDDLRAAYASAADIAEGKRVADASCAGCHGASGISNTKDAPHLAGQRPGYLYLELRAYQSGARGNSTMGAVVRNLNDNALVKAAAYYASLDPAQASPAVGTKTTPAQIDPAQAGKAASAACAGCHGDAGVSKMPGTPSLTGLDPQYLVAAMKAYKSGTRKNDVMKAMVSAIPDADLGNIAFYYALQKPGVPQTPAAGDPAAGKSASAACAGCHGDKGVSANPAIPSLAAQDALYVATALRSYKDGARSDETMKGIAAGLDEPAVKNLAAFYVGQQPQPTNVRKPLSTAEWAQRCDRCHGVNGNSTDPRLPALAAQRVEYLERVLHAYQTGERKSPQMAAMSDGLTGRDVENLAAYYARQKARAVVYIALPAK